MIVTVRVTEPEARLMRTAIGRLMRDLSLADQERAESIIEVLERAMAPRKPRYTCPCGFVGGSRNIRQHRINCPAWQNSCTTDAAREG